MHGTSIHFGAARADVDRQYSVLRQEKALCPCGLQKANSWHCWRVTKVVLHGRKLGDYSVRTFFFFFFFFFSFFAVCSIRGGDVVGLLLENNMTVCHPNCRTKDEYITQYGLRSTVCGNVNACCWVELAPLREDPETRQSPESFTCITDFYSVLCTQ